jgi:hypothetical protein
LRLQITGLLGEFLQFLVARGEFAFQLFLCGDLQRGFAQ